MVIIRLVSMPVMRVNFDVFLNSLRISSLEMSSNLISALILLNTGCAALTLEDIDGLFSMW